MNFPGPFALIGNGKTPTHATIITKLKSIKTFPTKPVHPNINILTMLFIIIH